ncbi:MAG: glycerophosphodiester phosphodiesterase family protein [Bacteroidota bacterium]
MVLKFVNICFLALILCLNVSNAFAQQQLPVSKHDFIVIAHRGDHVSAPENSLAAIKSAIAHGVDFVEIDLRTTKDSVLMIMHDNNISRTTIGKGYLSNFYFEYLHQFYLKDLQEDTLTREKIPMLSEVLALCKDKINIYLDFKDADAAATWKLMRAYKMEKQFIVYINKPQQLIDWRKVAPEVPLMVSLPDSVRSVEKMLEFTQKYNITLLDGDYTDYSPEMVAAAAKAGITIWTDIQGPKEAENWPTAIEKGLKGLQTDHPEALIEWLKQRGLR